MKHANKTKLITQIPVFVIRKAGKVYPEGPHRWKGNRLHTLSFGTYRLH